MISYIENCLVFRPCSAKRDWQPPPIDDIRDVELTTSCKTLIHAWHYPHPSSDRAVLYFHGNAGNLSHRGGSIVKLGQILNASVLIVDYPGYGKSGGRPTERGCYAAGDAAYAWLTREQQIHCDNLFLYGGSLGGAVAVDLAVRQPCRALILVKTFTSAPDVGARWVRWFPVRWFMRNQFNSLAKIGAVKRPIFMGHGTTDTVVPFDLGRKLYAAANEPKAFFTMHDEEHNQKLGEEFFRALQRFLVEHGVA